MCLAWWLEKAMAPPPVLVPGKSHGRRSLEGCSPWGHWGLDTTERLHFYFSLSCIGEGNGNPLRCSCLGNPRDRGAWWAAVYGVTQSRTRLKRLSSSSSILSGHHFPSHAFSIVLHICLYSGLFSSLIIFLVTKKAFKNVKQQWDITSHRSEWLSSKCLQTINAGEGWRKGNTLALLVGM